MRQLLSFEYRKLIRSKSIYICMIVMAALSIAGIFITKASMDFLNGSFGGSMIGDLDGIDMFNYSGLKYMASACSGSNITILFAIFVTIFICGDFTEGTIKNIVARGFSREKIFFAKSLVICTGTVIFGLVAMLVGFVSGTIAFGAGKGFDGGFIVTLLVQLLALIAYTMMNVLLGVLFGKLGGALTLGIIIPLVFPLLIQLLDLAVMLMAEKPAEATQDFFSRFTISKNLSNISAISVDGKDLLFAAVIFAVYILLFTLLGILSIRRKEV